MEQMYSNIEKAGIVFAMMGPQLSELILGKLPKDIVGKIQSKVLPLLEDIELPPDIDAFVLTEIIQNKKIVSAPAIKVEEPVQELIETEPEVEQVLKIENIPVEEEAICDWLSISEEELFERAPIELIIPILIRENKIFRGVLLAYFSSEKKILIMKELALKNIQVAEDIHKTTFAMKMENEIKRNFAKNLRTECAKPIE